MAQTLYDRTIAFAGVCQAVKLVQQIARDGTCDRDALEACLNSIVVTDPSNTIEIFGCEANLRIGLETLSARLTAHHQVTKLPVTLSVSWHWSVSYPAAVTVWHNWVTE